jgi:hypothetical protein
MRACAQSASRISTEATDLNLIPYLSTSGNFSAESLRITFRIKGEYAFMDSFRIVPEPTTLLLFGLSGLALVKNCRG